MFSNPMIGKGINETDILEKRKKKHKMPERDLPRKGNGYIESVARPER